MALDLNYKPNILVNTAGMEEDEWLSWRKKGVGGSDVAAALVYPLIKLLGNSSTIKSELSSELQRKTSLSPLRLGICWKMWSLGFFQRKLVSQYIRTRQCISIPCSHLCLLT